MDDINSNNPNTSQSEIPSASLAYNFSEDFANRFINQYTRFMDMFAKNDFYNPIYANNAMKQFTSMSSRPTERKLISWLNNPKYFERELRGCSEFLYWSVMQYQRSSVHFASILNWDYELIPLNPPTVDSDKKTIVLYQRQKQKNNEWLRKFRVKEQCANITLNVMKTGGAYYYLRESDNSSYLQGMPQDYCYINGYTDICGYTYSLNMSFFYQFPESVHAFAPEFADFYNEFLDKKNILNEKANPYRMMPFDKAFVFKFDDTRPEIIPPLSGSFKDAISIQDYKDLLKLQMELQTYQLIYLKANTDKDGKPVISSQEIVNYIALAQSLCPPNTGVISTPMEMESVNFEHAANMNEITGSGESNYWKSVGISGSVYGQDTKSSVAITNGLKADFNYMASTMYNQFERFLNFQLSRIEGKYNFVVKFLRRNEYFLDDDKKNTLSYVQSTGDVSRLLSCWGYEPYQHESKLIDNHLSNVYSLIRPLQSPFQTSGKSSSADKNGRPIKSDNELGDAGDDTRNYGGNEDK